MDLAQEVWRAVESQNMVKTFEEGFHAHHQREREREADMPRTPLPSMSLPPKTTSQQDKVQLSPASPRLPISFLSPSRSLRMNQI